jgi:hypothetical protein
MLNFVKQNVYLVVSLIYKKYNYEWMGNYAFSFGMVGI